MYLVEMWRMENNRLLTIKQFVNVAVNSNYYPNTTGSECCDIAKVFFLFMVKDVQ